MKRMTKNEKRVLWNECYGEMVVYAKKKGIKFFLIDFDRTPAEQRKFFRAGKSWTLNSRHLLFRAGDIAILVRVRVANKPDRLKIDWHSPHYRTLGKYWVTLHPLCVWGGNWKSRDSGHFEVR